ncbi:putative bifunctional diguanylate cyclase/phosphodiesterase [Domibacillus antri]|nr:EAL domain-containing protein [Domibacillus antri]
MFFKGANQVRLIIGIGIFSIIFTVFTSYLNFRDYQHTLNTEIDYQKALLERHIIQIVEDTNNYYKLLESSLQKKMEEYSHVMLKKYEENPDVLTWDLEKMKKEFDGFDIFIIDQNLTVVHTSFEPDLGLNFKTNPSLAEMFANRLQGNSFSTDRLEMSINTKELKKFSYIPTPDHKYLLELGINMKNYTTQFPGIDYESVYHELTVKNPFLQQLRVYKLSYTGYPDRVIGINDEQNNPIFMEQENIPKAREAIVNNEPKQVNRKDSENKSEFEFKYIPIISYTEDEKPDYYNSRIIEMVYNNTILEEKIKRQQVRFISAIALVSSVLTVLMIIIYQFFRRLEEGRFHLTEANTKLNQELNLRIETEDSLRDSETKYRLIADHTSDLIYLLDKEGIVNYCSPSVVSVLGYAVDTYQGENWFDRIHPEDVERVRELYRDQMINPGSLREELRYWHKEGVWIMLEINGKPIVNSNGRTERFVIVARDITQRKQSEETVRYMAYHDALTNLPNRRLLAEKLNSALEESSQIGSLTAVIYLDLDRFKIINDTLGHSFGDLVLKKAVKRIMTCIEDPITLARMGGDEFAIVLPQLTHEEEAVKLSRDILAVLTEPFLLNNRKFTLSASIGIAFYPSDGENVETLLKNADIAMYAVKDQGKNSILCFSEVEKPVDVRRLMLESGLRKALANNELFLVYQPQMAIQNEDMTGMEALLRWEHPELGVISPYEFIPIAEESGLIVPIGEWILRTACLQMKHWHKQGYPSLRMAVNLSVRQLLEPQLVDMVANVLKDTDFDPALLDLEITESMKIEDMDHMFHKLFELKKLGVNLVLDDFGTGYSSLSYLRKLPVDKLKVNQTFIRELTLSTNHAPIVRSVISMAKDLGIRTVAEGIESKEHLSILQQYQCDEIQGYVYSRPLLSKDMETFIHSHKHKKPHHTK